MRRLPLLCLTAALLAWTPLVAADRLEADGEASKGMEAMREADGDPHKGVDAAILFSHALTIYRDLGDQDAVCEMQANIFWCKKRMNLEDLQTYVAHKGTAASTAFAAAKVVMEEQVPTSESGAYLQRAQRFQSDHPDKHFEIAIRFSEIIERFPDSDAAKTAEPVFAKEQSDYLSQVQKERSQEHQQLQEAIDQVRSTRFMQPPAVSAGTTPIPDEAAQARALAAIRTTYHKAYQGRKESQRRALAHRLFAESDANRDDAAYFYVMLDESARLAVEAGDWEQMLQSVEREGQIFTAVDISARKRDLLSKVHADAVASAILTLLGNPKDRHANMVAGKAFCFSIQRWDLGLPMLADGEDADLHKVAEMELSSPQAAGEKRSIGDAWYELGRHGSSADRMAMWARAHTWYQEALPGLGGINGVQVQKRDQEILDALPLGSVDWDRLSVKQWDKVKGKLIVVESKVDRSNGVVMLTDAYRVRVVPHPDDAGKVAFQVGNPAPRQGAGVLTGNGQLWIIPLSARRGGDDNGQLRIKIVEIEDE